SPGVVLGAVLEQVWGGWLGELPARCLDAVFAALACRSGTVAEMEPVLAACGLGWADLGPAEERGVLVIADGRLSRWRPLASALVSRRTTQAVQSRVPAVPARPAHPAARRLGPRPRA